MSAEEIAGLSRELADSASLLATLKNQDDLAVLHTQFYSLWTSLAGLLLEQKNPAQARVALEGLLALLRQTTLEPDQPALAAIQSVRDWQKLATKQETNKSPDEARLAYEGMGLLLDVALSAGELGPEPLNELTGLLKEHLSLVSGLVTPQDLAREQQRWLTICELHRLQVQRNKSAETLSELASALDYLASMQAGHSQVAAVEQTYAEMQATEKQLLELDNSNLNRQHFARRWQVLADFRQEQGQRKEALVAYATAIQIRTDLAASHRDVAELQQGLGDLLVAVASKCLKMSELPRARKHLLSAIAIYQQLHRQEPESRLWQEKIANSHEWLADVENKLGRIPASLQFAAESLRVRKGLLERAEKEGSPADTTEAAQSAATALRWSAFTLLDAGRIAEARRCFADYEELLPKLPIDPSERESQEDALEQLVNFFEDLQDGEDAIQWAIHCVDQCQKNLKSDSAVAPAGACESPAGSGSYADEVWHSDRGQYCLRGSPRQVCGPLCRVAPARRCRRTG